MGQRGGDGAGRAGGTAVSVPSARHRKREASAGARDGGARLERRRPGLARQGDKLAAAGVEPATTGGSAASPVQSPAGAVGSHRSSQPLFGFAEVIGGKQEVWEYAALVTSLDSEILTLGQLYRDRADCENAFDELKNHWGWGGFTTQHLKRCRLLAASVALIYNWWSLFGLLGAPDQHREVITSRPLLLQAIARKSQHAGRTTRSVSRTD